MIFMIGDDRSLNYKYLSIVLGLFVLSALGSCSGENTRTEPKTVITVPASNLDTLPGLPQDDFDAAEFVRTVEPLLSSISGRRTTLRLVIDTITGGKTDSRNFFNALHPDKARLIRRFSFDPGKGYRELSLWVVCADYNNAVESNEAFKALHKQSGPVGPEDNLPGLTYTNDYVINTGNKIFWLNTGCIYSYANHQKIAKILLQTLNTGSIKDSIACKCGQPKCE